MRIFIALLIGIIIGYTVMSVSNWGRLKAFEAQQEARMAAQDLINTLQSHLIYQDVLIDGLRNNK